MDLTLILISLGALVVVYFMVPLESRRYVWAGIGALVMITLAVGHRIFSASPQPTQTIPRAEVAIIDVITEDIEEGIATVDAEIEVLENEPITPPSVVVRDASLDAFVHDLHQP